MKIIPVDRIIFIFILCNIKLVSGEERKKKTEREEKIDERISIAIDSPIGW